MVMSLGKVKQRIGRKEREEENEKEREKKLHLHVECNVCAILIVCESLFVRLVQFSSLKHQFD